MVIVDIEIKEKEKNMKVNSWKIKVQNFKGQELKSKKNKDFDLIEIVVTKKSKEPRWLISLVVALFIA